MMRGTMLVAMMGAAMGLVGVHAMAADAAGEITRLDGAAMITQGERFVAAQEGMKLQELDRLMVLEQSEAVIEFRDGCRHLMKEKELLTVGPTSVCAQRTAAADQTDHAAVQRTATSQLGGDDDAGLYIFGALALGGLIAGLTSESETTRPLPFTSPQ